MTATDCISSVYDVLEEESNFDVLDKRGCDMVNPARKSFTSFFNKYANPMAMITSSIPRSSMKGYIDCRNELPMELNLQEKNSGSYPPIETDLDDFKYPSDEVSFLDFKPVREEFEKDYFKHSNFFSLVSDFESYSNLPNKPSKFGKHPLKIVKNNYHRNSTVSIQINEINEINEIDEIEDPFICKLNNVFTKKPCNAQFSRSYDLTRHQNTIHAKKKSIFRCLACIRQHGDSGYDKTFSRMDALTRHIKSKHDNLSKEDRREITTYAKRNVGYIVA